MKKFVKLFLSLLLGFSLSACSSQEETKEKVSKTTPAKKETKIEEFGKIDLGIEFINNDYISAEVVSWENEDVEDGILITVVVEVTNTSEIQEAIACEAMYLLDNVSTGRFADPQNQIAYPEDTVEFTYTYKVKKFVNCMTIDIASFSYVYNEEGTQDYEGVFCIIPGEKKVVPYLEHHPDNEILYEDEDCILYYIGGFDDEDSFQSGIAIMTVSKGEKTITAEPRDFTLNDNETKYLGGSYVYPGVHENNVDIGEILFYFEPGYKINGDINVSSVSDDLEADIMQPIPIAMKVNDKGKIELSN